MTDTKSQQRRRRYRIQGPRPAVRRRRALAAGADEARDPADGPSRDRVPRRPHRGRRAGEGYVRLPARRPRHAGPQRHRRHRQGQGALPGCRSGRAHRQVVARDGDRRAAARRVRLSHQALQAGRDRSAAAPRAGQAQAHAAVPRAQAPAGAHRRHAAAGRQHPPAWSACAR